MKKEVDTYKLDSLLEACHKATLWGWYLMSVIIGAVLWFYPIPQKSIQTFAFAVVFIFYTLLSIFMKKLESIRTELK